jgi:hypothetical protein
MSGVRSEIVSAASFYTDPFGSGGYLIQDEPGKRVWVKWDGTEFKQCTVERFDPLLDENREEYNSAPEKMGDMPKVASIPLSFWFRNVLPAKKNGDQKWINDRILNNLDYRNFRTRPGRV